MTKIGFIGCGNMASAMIAGMLARNACSPDDIMVSARTQASRERAHDAFGVEAVADNAAVALHCDAVFLAVKPPMYQAVLAEVSRAFEDDGAVEPPLLISLAPGKTLEWLSGNSCFTRIVRIMPNTPAAVGEGMTSITANSACLPGDIALVERLAGSFGRFSHVPERLIDAVIPVSGSSPAFVYMFIEAMADAAVLEGMPRAQAYEFAAQAVLGSAKMVLESGKHPGELKDAVCSPGGTTIAGVRALERCGMRSAVIEALWATADKARSMA